MCTEMLHMYVVLCWLLLCNVSLTGASVCSEGTVTTERFLTADTIKIDEVEWKDSRFINVNDNRHSKNSTLMATMNDGEMNEEDDYEIDDDYGIGFDYDTGINDSGTFRLLAEQQRLALMEENQRLLEEIKQLKLRDRGMSEARRQSVPSQATTTDSSNTRGSNGDGGNGELATVLSGLADAIIKRGEGLPKKEPTVFVGDIFDYPVWINSFKVLVENRYPESSDRLYYLGKYTSGEAKESIKGLLAVNTEASYLKARTLLEERFGDKLRLARSFREKISQLNDIKPGDGKALQKLSDFLGQCETAMGTLSHLRILDDPEEYEKILPKLPKNIRDRWFVEVDNWLYGTPSQERNNLVQERVHEDYPPFANFALFIRKQARIASNPTAERCASLGKPSFVKPTPKPKGASPTPNSSNKSKSATSFASTGGCASSTPDMPESRGSMGQSGASSDTKSSPTCVVCKEVHSLESCEQFKAMSLNDRESVVKKNGLCFGCFKWGHVKRQCRRKMKCDICQRLHPTLLHNFAFKSSGTTENKSADSKALSATAHCVEADNVGCFSSLVVPVTVAHRDSRGSSVLVYALLDEQSDACFITSSTLEKLGVHGDPVSLKLATVLSEETVECERVHGLSVKGLSEKEEVQLPGTYTRDAIPAKLSQVPKPEVVRQWSHLQAVADQLPPFLCDVEIGLLIGVNCTAALKPLDVVIGQGDSDPYGVRTILGWGVIGEMVKCDCTCGSLSKLECRCTVARHFAFRTQTREVTPQQVSQMLTMEFNEKSGQGTMSYEDQRFLSALNDGIRQREDNHFELPLPLKEERVNLPNNRALAVQRLTGLKKKMEKDPKYKASYVEFMNKLIVAGQAERVPEEELNLDNATVWYLPHHGVFHPHKPGRIRVVFDCSAQFKGDSLNRHLLQGPDLINNLTGVLLRFRKGRIGFMCDIEKMFYQVYVEPGHRNFLRFLWWDEGDVSKPPSEFRMTVHVFGATSSPGVANFVLKHAADKFEELDGPKAAQFVREDFYVDDGLSSDDTKEEAKGLITDGRSLCKRAGFNLHKVVCNDREVLNEVPVECRAEGVQRLDVRELPIERALGTQWHVESDTFGFSVTLKDKPLTRRGILSTISSIYDPLGLVSPFLLQGKRIMQQLIGKNVDWDDPVPAEVRALWDRWRSDLQNLSALEIPRCYKPKEFAQIVRTELHHFSDASLEPGGLGQCSYLKLVDQQGRVATSLVMAKARVIPAKPITVPRLELNAAVISVNVGGFLDRELRYSDLVHRYYTDSKVVLGYISNEGRKFHIYVANRVQQIRETTTPLDWYHVSTDVNPADMASRGMSAVDLINSQLWWRGPEFLRSEDDQPCSLDSLDVCISQNDPEVKRTVLDTRVEEVLTTGKMMPRFECFSSWFHVKRSVALCLKYLDRLRERVVQKKAGKPVPALGGMPKVRIVLDAVDLKRAAGHHQNCTEGML